MKTFLAVIGGSAVISLGAVGFLVTQGHPQPAPLASPTTMNLGQTTTIVTPPSTPDTAAASPAVKAGGGS